jgi:hypothetical protein
MTPLETINEALTRVEKQLERGFKAQGKTLLEKISSVEQHLPPTLAKQLHALEAARANSQNVNLEQFKRSAASSLEQLKLLTPQKPLEPPVSQLEPQPDPKAKPRAVRLGASAGAKGPSKLEWWLFNTRKNIPQRAHAISRQWRIPMTILGLVTGAIAGYLIGGIGGAVLISMIAAFIMYVSYSEQSLAQSLYGQTRALELGLAFLRGVGIVVGVLILLVVLSAVAYFIAQNWNRR